MFLPGGVVIDVSQGVGAGTWSPTGERSADLTFVGPVNDPEAGFMGFITIRASVEVSEDGQTFTGTYTFEVPATLSEAFGVPPGQLGPGDATGRRVALETMGEPVGPLPDFSQQVGPGASLAAPGSSPMAPEPSPAVAASPMVEGSPDPEASPAA